MNRRPGLIIFIFKGKEPIVIPLLTVYRALRNGSGSQLDEVQAGVIYIGSKSGAGCRLL